MAKKTQRKSYRFVNCGDLHFDFDKRIGPDGKQHVTPVHDPAAFRAMLAFIKDYKPDRIGLMGDMFNMGPICRHEMDQPKKMEGKRLVETYEKGFKFFIEPLLETGAEITWMDGNHEAWAYSLISKFPGLDGMLDPYNYLKLRKHGIQFIPQYGTLWNGKLANKHGDFLKGGGKHAAYRAVDSFGSSIRIWHFHTKGFATRPTHKNGAYITGATVGCLCQRGPSYIPSGINSWMNGFQFGTVEPNGSFWDEIAVIFKGQTTINGKVYRG